MGTLQGLKDILNNRDQHLFAEGRKAIAFFNDKNNYPWMIKVRNVQYVSCSSSFVVFRYSVFMIQSFTISQDPRLCITFRMWLPLFNFVPAV
jgi:hypothetical protein